MRKRLMVAAATALMSVGFATAEAQVTVNITIGQQRVYPGIGGGAWNFTSDVGLGSSNLTSFIGYCFDNERQLKARPYLALTFSQFLMGTGAGPGGVPSYWNTLSAQDLNSMAALIKGDIGLGYKLDDAQLAAQAQNNVVQQGIWDIGNNTTQGTFGGPIDTYSNSWMVLVDKGEWEAGLDGQRDRSFYGTQSLLIEVPGGGLITPEPSTYALMVAGLAGIAFVARRRRVS